MGLKNFDYKQFLLEKGERLGLIIALSVMALLLIGGSISGFSLDGPDRTAATLKDSANGIRDKVARGTGVPLKPLDKQGIDTTAVASAPYHFPQDPILPWSLETKGRQNPRILEVESGIATFVKGAVWVPDVQTRRGETYVRVLVKKGKIDNPVANARNQAQQQWLEMLRRQGFNPPPVGPGGRPNTNFAAPDASLGLSPSGSTKEEYKTESVRLDALQPDAHLAKTVSPVRMAVVSAAFPYRRQLEEYGLALLRGSSLNNFASNPDLVPHFQWFNIRRRTLDAAGKVVVKPGTTDDNGWEEIKMEGEFGWIYRHTLLLADRKDREDPGLEPIQPLFPGLVYPRLPLVDATKGEKDLWVGDYPPVHLREVENSIRVLTDKAKASRNEVRLVTQAQRLLTDANASPFDAPTPPAADPQGPRTRPQMIRPFRAGERPAPPPGDTATADRQELVAPDYCLVRFTDVTVKPGFSYEYQVQIRAKNPNFNKPDLVAYESLAQKADLEGGWGPQTPIKVTLPEENFTYASDVLPKDGKDQAVVQVHRWLESIKLLGSEVPVPLGNWVIADVPVRRGEFLGRTESVEVPMWFSVRETFDIPTLAPQAKAGGFAVPARKEKGIPLDLTTRDVLADYEGGKMTVTARKGGASTVNEEAGYELLVVSPDGKLRVLNGKLDAANADRSARQKEWQSSVENVRKGSSGKPATGSPFN